MMATIAVREDLLEPIRKLAEEEGKDVQSLVEGWLLRELALAREEKLREESGRFRARHAELRAQFPGEYVALRNGAVLDHDRDARELYLRVQRQHGDEAILIAPVTDQALPEFRMRSPRIASQ
jgi:hypothetical protein